jgi:hypothetical protein
MLLEVYLRCSGGLAKQATGRKPVVCALCTHRPGGASRVILAWFFSPFIVTTIAAATICQIMWVHMGIRYGEGFR